VQTWLRLSVATTTTLLAGCGLFGSEPPPRHTVGGGAAASAVARPTYGETYIVTRGDTLYSIAFRNQLDYHDLADWNGIGRDYTIRVGQRLRLTPPKSSSLPPPGGAAEPPTRSAASVATTKPSAGDSATPVAGDRSLSSSAGARTRSPSPATSAIGIASASSGEWEWPTRGKLLRGFEGGGNKGIDIGGDIGQIVVASRGGKVVYSGSALKGYGELIIIKHDEDTLSAYGYNRKRLVEEGDSVAAGQPIAELGLGPEQRALLHFEIRERGKPVDPKALLPAR